jgi:hypothetical protein
MIIAIDYSQIISWALILLFSTLTIIFLILIYKQIARTYSKVGNKKLIGVMILGLYICGFTSSVLIILSLIISKGNFLAALFYFSVMAPMFLPIMVIAGIGGFYYSSMIRGQIINGVNYFVDQKYNKKN